MEKRSPERPALQIQWKTEQRVLTLERVPVLELTLSYPQAAGGGRGGARISRYYQKLAQIWQDRWGRETYWWACIDRVQKGARFAPWTARLEGSVRFQNEDLLSIRMDAREVRGDGRSLQVRTGDLWKLPEGVPLPVRSYFPGDRRWWLHLTRKLREQGEARRAAGDCFLDPDFGGRLRRWLSPYRCCRTPEGLEFYVPQCTLAPSAEGVVTFSLPLTPEPK